VTALRPMGLHADRGVRLVAGEGAHLVDDAGRRYLDLMSNYGVNVLGHAHPAVAAAVAAQAATLGNAHQSFGNPVRERFLEVLGAALPAPLARVSFANSGAETVEAALKFARVATGRHRFLAFNRAYHGRTFGAVAVTAAAHYRDPFEPMLEGAVHVPFGDLDAVDAILSEDVAAVVVEPIQGEAGIRLAPDGFLRGLSARCRAAGVLLVADEVQTAFRTGATLACDHEGVVPDVLCLSKGIANGFPMGVTVVTEEVAERVPRGSHGSTFAGSPLACAAGIATLEVLGAPGFHAGVASTGAALADGLRGLGHPLVREVRGRGLMLAVELRRPVGPLLRGLQERGVLVCAVCGDTWLTPTAKGTARRSPSVTLLPLDLEELHSGDTSIHAP